MRLIVIGFVLFLAIFFLPNRGYFILQAQEANTSSPATPNIIPGSLATYVINLKRAEERYATLLPYVEKLGFPFERFEAVDGSHLNHEALAAVLDIEQYVKHLRQNPKKGTIGCYLSHVNLWKQFLATQSEFALILEDDIVFDPLKVASAVRELASIPEDWDVVLLEIHHRGFPLCIKKLRHGSLCVHLFNITHTGAYLINRKAAAAYVKHAFPMTMPIDHFFTRGWEMDLKVRAVERPRLVQQRGTESFIEGSENLEGSHNQSLLKRFYRASYTAQTQLIRFIANLGAYLKTAL